MQPSKTKPDLLRQSSDPAGLIVGLESPADPRRSVVVTDESVGVASEAGRGYPEKTPVPGEPRLKQAHPTLVNDRGSTMANARVVHILVFKETSLQCPALEASVRKVGATFGLAEARFDLTDPVLLADRHRQDFAQ